MIMLLLVAVSVHGTTYQATEATTEDTESLHPEVDTASANFQSIPEKRDLCSALKKRLLQSQVL